MENKKGKFYFTSLDEIEEDVVLEESVIDENKKSKVILEDQAKEIKFNDKAEEVIKEKKEEEKKYYTREFEKIINPNDTLDNDIGNNIYISFETRLIILIVMILLFLSIACFFMIKCVSNHKNTTIEATEESRSSYQVCTVNDNCLAENLEYQSNSIDNIKMQFQYLMSYDDTYNYNLSYHVSATTRIYDPIDGTNIYYSSEDVLTEMTNASSSDGNINITCKNNISYNKYLSLVTKNSNFIGNKAEVEVSFYITNENESKRVSSITIPLTLNGFKIKKDNLSPQTKIIEVGGDTWSSENTTYAVVSTIFIILSLITLFITTNFVMKVTKKKNKYQDKLNDIFREYDRLIVIARDGYVSNIKKKIIKVDTFEELLDARDILEKPIIFSKINEIKSEFIVEDDDKLYKYVLKEVDL